jgi:hypothetical protein
MTQMATLYHGTQAELTPGQLLTPEDGATNGHRDHLSAGYVFATEHLNLARHYGNGAPGGPTRTGYVYVVEALGAIEQDPAEEMAGSYRTRRPLRVVRLAETRRPQDSMWEATCGRHSMHFVGGCRD